MDKILDRPVRIIVIGAGNRGNVYSSLALERPDLCTIVAVAEPREFTRTKFVEKYKITPENVFETWKDIVSLPAEKRIDADCVIVAVQDQYHADPAIAFAKLKYDILLEKPMALYEEDCEKIYKSAKDNNVRLGVCHVLRYTRQAQKVKEYIYDSNKIGKIVNIQHMEPVGAYHFCHSYVRGNWKSSKWSSSMLMAKSCHDIDWIYYMMQPRNYKGIFFEKLIKKQKIQ